MNCDRRIIFLAHFQLLVYCLNKIYERLPSIYLYDLYNEIFHFLVFKFFSKNITFSNYLRFDSKKNHGIFIWYFPVYLITFFPSLLMCGLDATKSNCVLSILTVSTVTLFTSIFKCLNFIFHIRLFDIGQ